MLHTKLIVRILDADEGMLGWGEAMALARGDGTLWVEAPTPVYIERDGKPTYVSVHWCDVNVEIRSVIDFHKAIPAGNVMAMPGDWTAITVGPAAGGLPPVTVREPVTVGIPVGALGARTH